MEFSKFVYYFCLIINSLLTAFFIFNAVYTTTVPYKKGSEVVILLISGLITGLGIYIGIKYGYSQGFIWRAIGVIVASFLISIIWTFVGLLFFNGPINWQ